MSDFSTLDGKKYSLFIPFRNSSSVSLRSLPITGGLKISFIRPLGSRDLLFFRLFSVEVNSSSDQSFVTFFFRWSNSHLPQFYLLLIVTCEIWLNFPVSQSLHICLQIQNLQSFRCCNEIAQFV